MNRGIETGARFLAALMLAAGAACDNVDWGGPNLRLVPPPPATFGASDSTWVSEE